jgi:hypothetical protein
VLDHPPYSPDLVPADYVLLPKLKSYLKGRLFDSIPDIQETVASTSITIAKYYFNKGVLSVYDRVNMCV